MHYCPCENGEYKKYTKKQRAKYNDNVPKYCFQNYKWWQSSVKNYFLSFRQLSHFPNNSFFSSCIVLKIPTSLKQRNRTFFFRFILLWPYFGSTAVFPSISSEPTESLAFSEWEMSSIVWGDCERVLEHVVESESNVKTGLTLALSPMHCSISFWNFQFYVLYRFLVIFDFFLFWFQFYHFRKPCSPDTFISACLLNSAPVLFSTVTFMFACPIRPLNWR